MTDARLVRDVGEFALIDILRGMLPDDILLSAEVPVGIGDDCSIWQPKADMRSVITTDSLVEGVHFRTDWTDWRSLGWKMLAVNLSDIASMGARPVLAVITLALTGNERVDDLCQLYQGMADLAEPHGVVIAGGDIVRASGPLMLSITAIGEGEQLMTRDAARPGDVIAVTGTLGASGAGLRLLQDPSLHRDATTRDLLIAAHLRPQPRLAAGRMLAHAGVTCCMDLSDGLLGDLPKILRASHVSATLDARQIPALPAVRALFPAERPDLSMRAGEDYELLFTVAPESFDKVRAAAEEAGATVTAIGHIDPFDVDAHIRLIGDDGRMTDLAAGAFDHFG